MKVSLIINSLNPDYALLSNALQSAKGFDEILIHIVFGENHEEDGERRHSILVKAAEGDWILCFSDDDYFQERHLAIALNFVRSDPEADVIFSKCIEVRPDGSDLGLWGCDHINSEITRRNMIPYSSFIRAHILKRFYQTDDHCIVCPDWALWLKVWKAGYRFLYFPHPFYYHVQRPGSHMDRINARYSAGEINRIVLRYANIKEA